MFARWRYGYVHLNSLKYKMKPVPSPLCRLCLSEPETRCYLLFRCKAIDPRKQWRLLVNARQVYRLDITETCSIQHILGLADGLYRGKARKKQMMCLMKALDAFLEVLK